jgi:hypothetical protein
MKFLGFKFRIEIVILCLLLGMLIHALLFCGCSKITYSEGFQIIGSALGSKMGENINSSVHNFEQKIGTSLPFRSQDHDSYNSSFVSPENSLNYFADTQFKPECCGSTYSANGGLLRENGTTIGGCACMSKKQIDYINTRGGNRTLNTEY